VEREIGTWPIADFINGDLFDILKERAKDVLNKVPSLTTVQDPPITVAGQSPGSGLLSIDKFSSLPLLLDAIREASDEAREEKQKQEKQPTQGVLRRLFLVPNAEVVN